MIVIDVGAQDGSGLALPCSQNPNITVYAIEPNPSLAAQLRSHDRANLHVHCFALGESEGTWHTPEIGVQRLDQFLHSKGLFEIDLLNIDAPTATLQILRGAGAALHSIRSICLKGQPLEVAGTTKPEIVEYLSDRGFELIRCVPQTDGLEENLEFVRNNRYRSPQADATEFEVTVPYVGRLKLPKNDHVGQLLEQGTFECWEQAFLWLYLREGDTFFDCGTHAGLFSAVATQAMSHTGAIVGFEPNPVCLDLYCANLKHLGCRAFRALQVGLSDQDGTAELLLGKQGMTAFSSLALGAKAHPQIGEETVQVPLRSLDSLMNELEIDHVDLAKLDIEGWEKFALDGAKHSIAAGKFPVWMIEFTEVNAIAAGSSTRELWQKIEQFGYTICRFDVSQFRLVPERQKEQYPYENLFAVMDLDAVNERLRTANSRATAIAQDIVSRWDLASDRQSLLREVAHLRTVYEHQQSRDRTLQQLEQENHLLKQMNAHLTEEIAYLSTGRAAFRKLIKGSLRRLGLYRFVYEHHQRFVPIYNWVFRDDWQPATLTKNLPTSSHSSSDS